MSYLGFPDGSLLWQQATEVNMEEEFECDVCGKGLSPVSIHSGDGNEELCFDCYHEIYDIDNDAE